MSFVFTLFAFIAVCALAAFAAGVLRLPAGAAPLVAVCAAMVWFTVVGCFGMLVVGGWLFFAAAAAALTAVVQRRAWGACKNGAFLLFVGAGLALLVLFAYKQPLYNTWDEFSFWGTAVKMTKINGTLYTTAEIGWPWVASQKPALVLLGWWANFLGGYAEWRAIFGLDLLALACICTLAAPLCGKRWYTAVCVAGTAFLVPYICTVYNAPVAPSNVYMNILSDVPMAWLFGGTLALYYALRLANKPLWPATLALAALTLTRDTALPLALIAAVILCADLLWCGKDASFMRLSGIKAKWCRIVTFMAAPVVSFVWWVVYLKLALNVNAVADIGGTEQTSMMQMLLNGLLQLLGVGRTEKFSTIMGQMAAAYTDVRLSMFGSGLVLSVFILALVALAALLAGGRVQRVRCILFGVLSVAGFVAYYIFIGFTYVFVLKDIESASLTGYERYIYPYYIGWFLVALLLLGISAAQNKKRTWPLAQCALFAVLAVSALRVWQFIPPSMTFVGYNDGYLYSRRASAARAEQVQALPGMDTGNIFYISQGDDGSGWFMTACELLPLQLDYSYGGGTLGEESLLADGQQYAIVLSAEQLCAYMEENGCTAVYVVKSVVVLVHSYGALFSDGLAACADGGSAVYTVQGTGSAMHFELAGEVSA